MNINCQATSRLHLLWQMTFAKKVFNSYCHDDYSIVSKSGSTQELPSNRRGGMQK